MGAAGSHQSTRRHIPEDTEDSSAFIYYRKNLIPSAVGIETGYVPDDPGIESRWGRYLPHLSRPALGPTQPPVLRYRVFPGGIKRPGRDADPSHLLVKRSKNRVELYLYSP
jgi:hypothetical protein